MRNLMKSFAPSEPASGGKKSDNDSDAQGRLLKETVELFKRASIDITEIIEDSRRLIFEFEEARESNCL